MSEASDSAEKLSEVLRLAALLSDQVLDAQIMKRPVPDEQVRALAGAATVLEEHGVPVPPLMTQALHEIERSPRENPDAAGVGGVRRLARLLGSLRRG